MGAYIVEMTPRQSTTDGLLKKRLQTILDRVIFVINARTLLSVKIGLVLHCYGQIVVGVFHWAVAQE